jgi:hypothetical protein
MRVKAVAMGYYGNIRIKPDTVFEMADEVALAKKDKDGQPVLPGWVIPADQSAKAAKGLKLPGAKVLAPKKSDSQEAGPLHESKGKKDKSKDDSGHTSTGDSDVI